MKIEKVREIGIKTYFGMWDTNKMVSHRSIDGVRKNSIVFKFHGEWNPENEKFDATKGNSHILLVVTPRREYREDYYPPEKRFFKDAKYFSAPEGETAVIVMERSKNVLYRR